jgi:hypothetical protein
MKAFKTKGQGLLEFALVLPILLAIILGVIEAALVIQGHLAAQHIARETARWAITYQPLQGACIDKDRDGQLADDGVNDDADDYAPYPSCPYPGWSAKPLESDADYYHRRIALIKQKARDTAAGLRIREENLGMTETDFWSNLRKPGFFGVRVWGYPSFETDCNDPDLADKIWVDGDPEPGCLDHPGLEGLPVRVQIVHNVEIIDPIYRVIAEFVTVQADAQMVNEGVQVGYGDQAPPGFVVNPNPIVGPPGGEPPPEETPENTSTPRPSATPPPTYSIALVAYPEGTDQVTNLLPDDRCHDFLATVTYDSFPIQSIFVSFSTTWGAFNQSGIDEPYTESLTNALGQAMVTLCGNEPGVATLRAWIDADGNNLWQGEINDTAAKEWQAPSGPYILVNDHEVVSLDTNSADIMNHPIAPTDTYDVYWCVDLLYAAETFDNSQMLMTVIVDGDGNAENRLFTVPANSDGMYRLETHPVGGGGCGAADMVARSGIIHAVVALPELVVSITDPLTICPQTYFTMSATIENLTSGSSDEYFDVDFYVDPGGTPYSPIGQSKQWVNGIGPHGTVVVNAVLWVETEGTHEFWVRVDTSNYVEEGNEDDNVDVESFTTGSTGAGSSSTGWRNPTGNYVGTTGFTNPSRAYMDGSGDGGWATRDNVSGSISHIYRNYGLGIPADATIEGIQVGVDWWLDRTRGTNRIDVYLSWNGGSNWTAFKSASTERTSDGGGLTDVVGGAGDTWGRTWTPSDLSSGNFRVKLELYSSRTDRDFRIDWVPVQVTYSVPATCVVGSDPCPWCEGPIKPPGLLECTQLLQYGNFEGNVENVLSVWHPGPAGAYQRQSAYFHDGTLSMRLHTTVDDRCGAVPDPYLYQAITIPAEVYTQTTLTVSGYRLVDEGLSGCCNDYITDPDDVLYLKMKDGGGSDLAPGNGTPIVNGGVVTATWAAFSVDVTDVVSPVLFAGQDVQVYFHGIQDVDYDCTFFYLDTLKCDLCTYWPIPPEIPGTASFGGLVQVFLHHGIPQALPGIDVWAYSASGEVYHTQTIHDGTYHFYNVPPGTYTIYAEYWEGGMGGTLHYGMRSVTVEADERVYNINLYLS